MTERGLNILRKIAAEFPNMPAPKGGWGPAGLPSTTPKKAAPKPQHKRPVNRQAPSKAKDLAAAHREIDNDSSIPDEHKEAEKRAATDLWNQVNYR